MVVVRASSLAVLAVLAVATTAHASSIADVPAYVVPAVDYTQLFSSSRALLDAMQHDGIVALKNVPGYASLRREYLRKAAECAVHAKDHGAEFLLHRRLQDGTQRYTISTESGRRLDASGFETVENCPGYQQIYHQFSRSIEEAVAKVGRALDASQALQVARRRLQKSGLDTMTAHALMAESLHLDHFHAYEASPTRRLAEKTLEELSLEMHTDNGLMIAMTTPEYFTVAPSGEVTSRETRSEDAGLLIKTAEGKTVRPLLQADELVLMLGEGIQTWIHTTPKLQAVTHGMQYPRGLSYTDKGESHQSLRAWFGKMILLSEDHVMANTGLPYGEFANKTTRYLLDDANDKGFAAIACSPHRRLQSSDDKCTVRTGCKLRPDGNAAAVPDGCAITCNHKADDDKKLCADNCQCEAPTNDGSYCWMLCVPMLSTSECAGEQKCNDAFVKEQLAMTCAAGGGGGGSAPATTTAPTTTTIAPTTIAPTTVAPTTVAPTTRRPTSKTPAPPTGLSGSQGSSQTVGKVTAPDLTSGSSTGSGTSGAEVKTTKPKSSPTPKPSATKSAASSLTSVATLAVALVGASLMN